MRAGMALLRQIAAAPLPSDVTPAMWIMDDDIRQHRADLDEIDALDTVPDTPRLCTMILADDEARLLMCALLDALDVQKVSTDETLPHAADDLLPTHLPLLTADHLLRIIESLGR